MYLHVLHVKVHSKEFRACVNQSDHMRVAYTGCFNSVFDTLSGYYNKYTMRTEKIVVDFFSVHRDISFHNNKLEKITVHTVKIWIGNLMWFLPQNSTYNFEAVWG